MVKGSTSQRSWRQNLAQGGASAVKRNPGLADSFTNPARWGILFGRILRAALRFTSFRYACPGLNSDAGYAGSLSGDHF
jgi:hypothetical protein